MSTGYINMIEDMVERPSGRKFNINNLDILKQIRKCPFSGKLEERKKNIVGWPFIPEIGGHFLDELRFDKRIFPEGTMNLSEIDKHPNAKAQFIISDIFYDRWKTLYG